MKRLGLLLAILLAGSGDVRATIVTFTETTTATGSFAGMTFIAAPITFTQTVDTSQVVRMAGPAYAFRDLTSTVTMAGFGTASFGSNTYDMIQYYNNVTSFAFIYSFDPSGFVGIYTYGADISGDHLADLQGNYGPVAVNVIAGQTTYATSAGPLTINSTGPTGTLQSAIVPEPASIAMFAAGLATTVASRRLRRRAR